MSGATMRAVLLDGYDGFEKLRVGDVGVPQPGPGQLLVRVHATGVNPVDIVIASGAMQKIRPMDLPAVVGIEVSGVVVAVADNGDDWKVGDEIHATIQSGAFAEYALVPAASAVLKPAQMSFSEAAALPVAAATATAALDSSEVGKDTKLVVHAAAGGLVR